MSRTLTAHVSLWDEAGKVVILAPGDEVPGWAEGRVGPHCLTPALAAVENDGDMSGGADGDSQPESDAASSKRSSTTAPDFTSSAPRRGRPRK